jgi:2-dehydropantoate 2-reductase
LIQEKGVRLREIDGTITRVRVPVRKGPLVTPGTDILIVAVKAYDTKIVALGYKAIVPQATTVLSLQNGLGNIETLASTLKNEILGGSTTEGAYSSGPGDVTHTGKGLTIIGDPQRKTSGTSSRLKTAFDKAELRTKASSNIRGVLWTKTIINAAINPLSSLTGMPNGALAHSATIRSVALEAINEGMAVCDATGVGLVGDPRKLWRRILLSTKENRSSMLQDIERGRMTEIRQLNGAILSGGKKRGVKTPVNEILTKLVLALEESSKARVSPA